MPRFIPHLSCFILLFPALAFSQARPIAATPKEDGALPDSKFSLTLYSQGYGLVREIRKLSLSRGENSVNFTQIAAGIDPTTVSFKSLTAPESTTVLEQSFAFDLADPDKLLQKYLGKSIIVNRKQEPVAGDRSRMPETIEAKLLAFTKEQLVLQTNNKQLPIQIIPRTQDILEIKLFDLTGGLATRPTLIWKVAAEKPGDHDVLVSYQTQGLTWSADYNIVVNKNESAADLSSWITLANESGASYPNAKLTLMAGDVHTMRPRSERVVQRAYVADVSDKLFFEYHLYRLSRPISLPDKSTRQVEFFPAKSGLPITRTYVFNGFAGDSPTDGPALDPNAQFQPNKKVDVYLKLANSEKTGLGLPLPAGRVRVYKRDEADGQGGQGGDEPAGALEFIGEDTIDHTPKDEQILCRLGSAFDLAVERKQTQFAVDNDKHVITESFEIKLRNHKPQPVEILVKETLYRWHQWEITAASEKFQKHDSRTIHIPVQLQPNEEKVLTYTAKYTW
jgi:hypothetical protein